MIVQPATVVAWHRAGFQAFWRWRSRAGKKPGRPSIAAEVRELIRRMAQENPTWGAPRIHGELLKLGFRVSERTVQNRMPKRSPSHKAKPTISAGLCITSLPGEDGKGLFDLKDLAKNSDIKQFRQ